jgi:choice-of-anchor C domain-containing protein
MSRKRRSDRVACAVRGVRPGRLGLGLLVSSALVLAASASSAVASTDLIQNGGFEQPSCAVVCDFGVGTGIPGWTVGAGTVDVVAAGYEQPASGNQFLDLAGDASGSVSQSVATTAGADYVLTWAIAGNPRCGQRVKTMDVDWNEQVVASLTFDTTDSTSTSLGWVTRSATVTATGSQTILEFADATPDSSMCGATLDDVSLVESSPPATPTVTTPAPSSTAPASGTATPPAAAGSGTSSIVQAPSTKACMSRRSFVIHIHRIPGLTYRQVTVYVAGRRVYVLRGGRITAPVNLRGLSKGRYTVKIVAITTTGKRIVASRTYHTCTPKSLPASNHAL